MTTLTFYHNPQCSKSRAALALLQDKSIDVNVIDYNQQLFTFEQLNHVIDLLGIEPRAMIRTNEAIYKQLNLEDASLSRDDLVRAMVVHPALIQRPIVVKGNRAIIARPPEVALTLLDE